MTAPPHANPIGTPVRVLVGAGSATLFTTGSLKYFDGDLILNNSNNTDVIVKTDTQITHGRHHRFADSDERPEQSERGR